MNYGTYLSASGMQQALASQAVIANNLANVETNGFKRVLTLHGERGLSDNHNVPDQLAGMTGGKLLLPTHLDASQGGPEQTGRALDVAIVGEGWLQVRTNTPQGDQDLLTRDGRLMLTKDGNLALVTDPGATVLDDDGQPIVVGRDTPATNLEIDAAGFLRDGVTGEQIAKLAVVTTPIDQPNAIRPVGENLYATDLPVTPADGNTQLLGGFVERSNVDPTTELTRMMEATRFLEANAQMIRHQDTALGKLIDAAKLG